MYMLKIYICTYVYTCNFVYAYVFSYVYVHVYHICVCDQYINQKNRQILMYINMCVYIYTYHMMYICTCVCMSVNCVYTHTSI